MREIEIFNLNIEYGARRKYFHTFFRLSLMFWLRVFGFFFFNIIFI